VKTLIQVWSLQEVVAAPRALLHHAPAVFARANRQVYKLLPLVCANQIGRIQKGVSGGDGLHDPSSTTLLSSRESETTGFFSRDLSWGI
jgi:hypothetical protein